MKTRPRGRTQRPPVEYPFDSKRARQFVSSIDKANADVLIQAAQDGRAFARHLRHVEDARNAAQDLLVRLATLVKHLPNFRSATRHTNRTLDQAATVALLGDYDILRNEHVLAAQSNRLITCLARNCAQLQLDTRTLRALTDETTTALVAIEVVARDRRCRPTHAQRVALLVATGTQATIRQSSGDLQRDDAFETRVGAMKKRAGRIRQLTSAVLLMRMKNRQVGSFPPKNS